MNQIESELEWLLYQLWTKVGAKPTKFSFTIPDTIFFRLNNPYNWYFTSKEGHVLKKNKINVTMKNIHQKFSQKQQMQDQVSAVTYLYQRDSSQLNILLDYVPVTDFRTYMFFEEELNRPHALQKFVLPKQGRNTVIKCHWSQSISVIERLSNVNSFYDQKLSLEERVTTFEGPEHLAKSENIVSSALTEEINNAVRQIEFHLKTNCDIALQSGLFYFKQDKNEQIVLIFATNLKIDKPDRFTNEQVPVKVKLFVKDQFGSDQLPAVIAPCKRQSNSRPQSTYSRQSTRQSRQSKAMKVLVCPFCESQLNSQDLYEFTFNQILKMYQYYEDNSHLLLESADTQQKLNFNKRLLMNISNSKGKIPDPFLKLLPSLTYEKFIAKKTDPLFLYETMKLCEVCYQFLKQLVEQINLDQPSKEQKIETISKLSSLVYNHPIVQNQIQNQSQKRTYKHRSGIPKTRTGALNSDIMFSQASNNITKQSMNTSHNFDQISSGFQKVIRGQDASVGQKSHLEQDSQQVRILDDYEQYNISDTSSSNKGSALMTFQKVEKGKEAGQASVFNYPKEAKEDKEEEIGHKPKIMHPQFNFVKVQNVPKEQKRVSSNKAVLPKLNWQKEYKEKVKKTSEKIKGDIFQVIDQIEAGQSVFDGDQDSLDLKILNGKRKFSGVQSFHQTGSEHNLTAQAPFHRKEKFDTQRLSEQPKQNNGNQLDKIMKAYRKQSSNPRVKPQNQQPAQAQRVNQKPRRNISSQNENRRIRLLKNDYSQQNEFQEQSKVLNEVCLQENQLINQQQQNQGVQKQKMRPQSSKQQTKLTFSQNHNVIQSTTSQKHLLLSNREVSSDRVPNRREEQKKPQLQIDPEYNPYKNPGGGLLNFQNMTSDDIKHIATNADQLIEIIKNIKEKIVPPSEKPLSYQLSPGLTNVHDTPCFEDDREDDLTQSLIPSKKESQNGNKDWW